MRSTSSSLDIIVITGLSGSGKSVAIRALEDNGFFCIDNLPVLLIPKFIELCQGYREEIKRVALGVDRRAGQFFNGWPDVQAGLRRAGHDVRVVFLEASDQLLLRRFSETRRPHPLQGDGSIREGIARERTSLEGMRALADRVIDTSNLNVHELRREIEKSLQFKEVRRMTVFVTSFGYKFGIPLDSDMVIDVRFLPNPFFVNGLRGKNGLDTDVQDFVLRSEETPHFLDRLCALLEYVLPRYEREGKSNFTLALGCTGGKHRSVVLANALCRKLNDRPWRIETRHRDVDA